jgi:hypothetical protein
VRTRAALAIMLVVTPALRGADRVPGAAIAATGELTITLPGDLLRSREVQEQLTSGLTTVFLIATTASDGKDSAKGGARIEVRYALWEEQYLVSLLGPTGEERRLTFPSAAALERWWTENPLTVGPPRRYGPRVDVRVKLTMLPFSSREQSDTRRWLARTLSDADAAGDRTPAQSAEILRIIVETSIRRRPLLEREWSARAVAEGQP